MENECSSAHFYMELMLVLKDISNEFNGTIKGDLKRLVEFLPFIHGNIFVAFAFMYIKALL